MAGADQYLHQITHMTAEEQADAKWDRSNGDML